MIIDMHYHQIPMMPEELIPHTLEDPIRAAKLIGLDVDIGQLTAKAKAYWSDPDGEKLLAAMDEAGIDFTVICAVDNATSDVFTEELVRFTNQTVAAVARKHPDRVMALAGVDPRRPKAVDLLKQCFEEFGMKGLKYHADYGYDPSGPESYKLLEFLEKKQRHFIKPHRPFGATVPGKICRSHASGGYRGGFPQCHRYRRPYGVYQLAALGLTGHPSAQIYTAIWLCGILWPWAHTLFFAGN